jgi:hypothetical protein
MHVNPIHKLTEKNSIRPNFGQNTYSKNLAVTKFVNGVNNGDGDYEL